MDDGIRLNMSLLMKTTQTPMDLMDQFGEGRIIVMNEWWNLVIWINHLRIALIGRRFLGCLGTSSPCYLIYYILLLPLVFICLFRTGRIELMIGTTLECRLSDNLQGISADISSSDGISSSGPRYVISHFHVNRKHGINEKKY
jgi:hypothetical protein